MTLLLATATAILIWAGFLARASAFANRTARLRQDYGAARAAAVDLWVFDRLDRIGDHPTTILGNPRVIDSPIGKAVEFDGVDDALVVDVHPLAGAETFTWEAIFRPDGGQAEQRWFHLQESGSAKTRKHEKDSFSVFPFRAFVVSWLSPCSSGETVADQPAALTLL